LLSYYSIYGAIKKFKWSFYDILILKTLFTTYPSGGTKNGFFADFFDGALAFGRGGRGLTGG
jgi:hypothetical protein